MNYATAVYNGFIMRGRLITNKRLIIVHAHLPFHEVFKKKLITRSLYTNKTSFI